MREEKKDAKYRMAIGQKSKGGDNVTTLHPTIEPSLTTEMTILPLVN
jgi:hypothetical protein